MGQGSHPHPDTPGRLSPRISTRRDPACPSVWDEPSPGARGATGPGHPGLHRDRALPRLVGSQADQGGAHRSHRGESGAGRAGREAGRRRENRQVRGGLGGAALRDGRSGRQGRSTRSCPQETPTSTGGSCRRRTTGPCQGSGRCSSHSAEPTSPPRLEESTSTG